MGEEFGGSVEMNARFGKLIDKMPSLLRDLESQPFLSRAELAGIPKQGIYVFYQKEKAVYVGRSNRLKERIQEHGRPSSDHYSATLAFRIAKKKLNYEGDEHRLATRDELEQALGFKEVFFQARLQVAEMQVKIIGIDDQITQALFEIYAALTLNTQYNDFGTH
ncbi:GIY-YIG nuclease family protein [Chloroflexota bacterium]